MKKLSLLILTLSLSLVAFAQSKVRIERVEPDSVSTEYVQYRTKSNHWSFMGSLGVGRLDGDQVQAMENLFPRTFDKMTGLLNIEYTVSPIWGIYMEYMYNPYGGFSVLANDYMNVSPHGVANEFHGRNHEVTLGGSINLLNLFYNCRPQRWQWYFNLGAGVSIYDMREHSAYPDENYPVSGIDGKLIPDDYNSEKHDLLTQSKAASISLGSTFEWNATRWLALLANFQYRFHAEDNYDASIRGNSNDHTMFAGLGLRLKINNPKYQHVRDMAMCQYELNMADENAKKALKKTDELEPRVEKLEKRVDDLEPRVKALEDDMANLRDSDGDGVPDIRDREPNTPNGVPVNSFGETVKPGADNGMGIDDSGCLKIYFNTAKYNMLPASEAVLAEVARRLQEDPSLKVEIRSYADEQGVKNNYNNQRLTDNRAKQTRNTLIKKYGVDAKRIVLYQGFGAVLNAPSIDYMPNRRSDICLVK